LLNVLPKDINIENVDVWYQDEARIGQKGTLTRTWAIKGTRPRLVRQQQFEYAYLFGAVCPARDEAVAIVMPAVNTDSMLIHLQHISAKIPEGRHAVIILDRATWHTTKRLKQLFNITLLSLPPASPELNPTEQVWQLLRSEHLANRCFTGYEDIVQASCDAWNWFVNSPGRVKKLCTRTWSNL
jgi:transposase